MAPCAALAAANGEHDTEVSTYVRERISHLSHAAVAARAAAFGEFLPEFFAGADNREVQTENTSFALRPD